MAPVSIHRRYDSLAVCYDHPQALVPNPNPIHSLFHLIYDVLVYSQPIDLTNPNPGGEMTYLGMFSIETSRRLPYSNPNTNPNTWETYPPLAESGITFDEPDVLHSSYPAMSSQILFTTTTYGCLHVERITACHFFYTYT